MIKKEEKRLNLRIHGLVQGVFYRWESRKKAREMNIKGWVKNMPDGTVYIVAEGNIDTLKEFKKWCEKGPKFAKVEKTEENWEKITGEFEKFEVR